MVDGEPEGGARTSYDRERNEVTVSVDDASDFTWTVNWSNIRWEAAWFFTEPLDLHLPKHADPEWA